MQGSAALGCREHEYLHALRCLHGTLQAISRISQTIKGYRGGDFKQQGEVISLPFLGSSRDQCTCRSYFPPSRVACLLSRACTSHWPALLPIANACQNEG